MLPIEEGCIAIIIGTKTGIYDGVCLDVGVFIGKVKGFVGDDR